MLKKNPPIEPEELMAFLEGELSPYHSATAAAHFEQYRDCQGFAEDFQDVSRRLWSWEIETADPRVIAGVSAALDECRPHRPGAVFWHSGRACQNGRSVLPRPVSSQFYCGPRIGRQTARWLEPAR